MNAMPAYSRRVKQASVVCIDQRRLVVKVHLVRRQRRPASLAIGQDGATNGWVD